MGGVRFLARSSQTVCVSLEHCVFACILNLLAVLVVVSGIHMQQAQLKKLRSCLANSTKLRQGTPGIY